MVSNTNVSVITKCKWRQTNKKTMILENATKGLRTHNAICYMTFRLINVAVVLVSSLQILGVIQIVRTQKKIWFLTHPLCTQNVQENIINIWIVHFSKTSPTYIIAYRIFISGGSFRECVAKAEMKNLYLLR